METIQNIFSKVYDILIKEAGANISEYNRFSFIYSFTKNIDDERMRTTEYRFCGLLGFGGKFRNCNNMFYISCYPEDHNKDREKIINKTNKLLKPLYQEYLDILNKYKKLKVYT